MSTTDRHAYIGAAIHDGTRLHTNSALLRDGKMIVGICSVAALPAGYRVTQLEGGTLTPGLVDLQVNGGGGLMFNADPNRATLETIARAHSTLGTAAIMPTLITAKPAQTQAAIGAVTAAIEAGVPGILGIHLEGPHLSVARRGAHDPSLIRPMTDADLELLVTAARSIPNVMVTVAPENVTQAQVAALAAAGVIVSLGHTDADFATCLAYIAAGARCATHLFNAMSQMGHRRPGLVGAVLDKDSVSAGLIADGIHVHPAVIGAALRAKQGPGRIYLVSDAMATVGSDIDQFELDGRVIFRRDGSLTLADGTLAGADIDLCAAIRVMVEQVGVNSETAIAMATSAPGSVLRNALGFGHLHEGATAKIAHLDKDLRFIGFL